MASNGRYIKPETCHITKTPGLTFDPTRTTSAFWCRARLSFGASSQVDELDCPEISEPCKSMILTAIPLVHRQHGPESRLPSQHVLHCLLRLLKRELLNHALHAMGLCKRNRVLRILSMARWPPADGKSVQHHRHRVDGHRADCSVNEELALWCQTIEQRRDDLDDAMSVRCHDQ